MPWNFLCIYKLILVSRCSRPRMGTSMSRKLKHRKQKEDVIRICQYLRIMYAFWELPSFYNGWKFCFWPNVDLYYLFPENEFPKIERDRSCNFVLNIYKKNCRFLGNCFEFYFWKCLNFLTLFLIFGKNYNRILIINDKYSAFSAKNSNFLQEKPDFREKKRYIFPMPGQILIFTTILFCENFWNNCRISVDFSKLFWKFCKSYWILIIYNENSVFSTNNSQFFEENPFFYKKKRNIFPMSDQILIFTTCFFT